MKRFACSTLMLTSMVAAVVLLLPTAAPSQNPEWMNFTTDNSGLPVNSVSCLAVDSQGNPWIGTGSRLEVWLGGGLARFDGARWEVYDKTNSGVPGNSVLSIAFDAQGSLWIGAWGGLARFDGESWAVYDTANSGLLNDYVKCLAFDPQGNLWIGTRGGGLAVYREGGVILPGTTTAVLEDQDQAAIPTVWSLSQNYPNPFNSRTVIRFALPTRADVHLALYNLAGQKVATLVSGPRPAGTYTVHWDGRDASGRDLASGVYLYRLRAGEHQVETRRLLLLR